MNWQRSSIGRALGYVVPYWRRLALVGVLSLVSTGLSLLLPYLSKTLIDSALAGRNLPALYRTVGLFTLASVAGFVLTAITGLTYTRVSADVLFDMRLAVYRHLQRLSPKFFARTPLGDILARVNNDVGEIQRVAAESLLAWAGNILFLAGSVFAMVWLDWRLALVGLAMVPPSVWALSRVRAQLQQRVRTVREASAAIGSFLVQTLQGIRLVITSNAQGRGIDTGIHVDRVRVVVFMLCSMMAAVGGIMLASRLLAVNQSSGSGDLLLLAIAGPVIAGTSLFGGRGSVWTALTGGLVIQSISNGMDLLALESSWKFMVTGAVLLIAVIIDSLARRQRQAAGRIDPHVPGSRPVAHADGPAADAMTPLRTALIGYGVAGEFSTRR